MLQCRLPGSVFSFARQISEAAIDVLKHSQPLLPYLFHG
jgi:hypothetical protein